MQPLVIQNTNQGMTSRVEHVGLVQNLVNIVALTSNLSEDFRSFSKHFRNGEQSRKYL